MNYLLCSTLVTLLLLCSMLPVFAQKPDTSSTKMLHEVVVKGDSLSKEIVPVQTLSGKQLKKLSVYSVADAIRYFSGVQVKDYGGIGGLKTVNVRSLGTQHVGVFYDGVQLGNAQNGTVDLGKFSLDNMTAISLYNGQKSAIFQSAKDFASASAIYMVSRTPEFTAGRQNTFLATLKSGSFGTLNPSVLWEHKINKHLSSSFNAEYMTTTGRYKFRYAKTGGYDTTEVRKNGDVNTLRLEGGLFGTIPDGDWKAKIYFYNSERGFPGAAVRENPGVFTHQDRQWDNNLFFQSSFRKKISDTYSLQLKGKYAYDYLHYLSDPRLDVSTMFIDNHFRQQEGYLSAANLFNIFPFWIINASADLQFNSLNANLYDFAYPKRLTSFNAIATNLDFNKLKIQASLLGTFVFEQTKIPNSAARDKTEYTPSLILSYQPWAKEDLNFRAFYKRIFRMPTLNDLYYTFIGNTLLDPEYTTQYNTGFTYALQFKQAALNKIQFQADAYFNQVKNKIVASPANNQFRWRMINYGYVEIRGIDAALQTEWLFSNSIALNARVNYTYQKAQDFTDKTSPYYGGQLPYVPWHSGSVVLNSSIKNWNLNYSFIYTGERYEESANIPENYTQSWYTHDLGLSRSLLFRKKELTLTAEVNNLLNQQYEVVQWYPMPGINYKLILKVAL